MADERTSLPSAVSADCLIIIIIDLVCDWFKLYIYIFYQVTRLTPLVHALGRMRTCLHMHACIPDEDWREGEGPCRSMIKCQARHEIMNDTTPMGPHIVNGWTYLCNRCMHACREPRRGTVGGWNWTCQCQGAQPRLLPARYSYRQRCLPKIKTKERPSTTFVKQFAREKQPFF